MPRTIRHHQANLPMTVTEVTETEIFPSHTVFDDRRDSTDGADAIIDYRGGRMD